MNNKDNTRKNFQSYLDSFVQWWKQRKRKLLISSLLFIVIGAFFASMVQTDWNNITITNITIPTQDGQYVNADIYRPNTATEDNPAACVIVVPGFQRTKETQIGMSLELARRGIVTVCIDPYSQGESSSTYQTQSATTEGYGLIPMTEYIYSTSNLNYIDKTQIGAAGHSAGGNACLKAAAYFGKEVMDGVVTQSKLTSVYVSGYVLTLTDDVLSTVRSNVGIGYAIYDEGAYRNENATDSEYVGMDADMRYAPEALRLVNSGLALNNDPSITEVEIGRIYGNPFNFTMRIVNNEETLHLLQPYDTVSLSHVIEFFDISFEANMTLSYMDQTWMWKEICCGLILVGGFMFALAVGSMLLKTKVFASLVHPIPTASLPLTTKKDHIIHWSTLVIGAVIAAVDFVPLANLSIEWFSEAAVSQLTWNFPARMVNAIMLWAVFNGIIGLIIFTTMYFIRGRKKDVEKATSTSIKIGFKESIKTLVCALIVFASFYLVDAGVYYFFHVDMRLFFVVARPIGNIKYLVAALMYVPFFFIFYISNSIRVNCSMRFQKQKEWVSLLIAGLANSVGLMAILVVQYVCFAQTGTVYWTDAWLYVNMVWGLIPMMFILPWFNRYFYNRTGRVWLGPMITCLIFIVMSLTNTVIYIPMI